MFKGKFENQFHLVIFLLAVITLFSFNYGFRKIQFEEHTHYHEELSQIILEKLTQNTVYGLFYSDKALIDLALESYKTSNDIAYIRIFDSQGNLFSEIDKRAELNIDDDMSLKIYRADVKDKPVDSFDQEDLFSDQQFKQNTEKLLGEIVLALSSSKYSKFENDTAFKINLALSVSFLLFWIYIYLKQRKNSRNINKAILSIDSKETNLKKNQDMISIESRQLMKKIISLNNANQHFEKQLESIKREVKIAREDGNTELHEFIRYIQIHGISATKNDLGIFYNSVLQNEKQSKNYLELKKCFKSILTDHSDQASNNQVIIYDSYTGESTSLMLKMYQRIFQQTLQFLISELIDICSNSNIQINFDVRSSELNSNMLRISICSESEAFLQAISEQSFFHFDKTKPISKIHNNIKLISAKHLLQKLEGEFFYFKDELRFEIPVETISIQKDTTIESNTDVISKDLNILVYDSDPIEGMVLMGYLEKLTVSAEKATNKQVILQKIRRASFDAIFVNSDFFSKPDPYFISNFINEISTNTNQFRILVLSNDESVVESPLYQQCNAHYINKPIDLQKLRKVLLDL